jgi:hypothetical protein
LSQYLRAFTLHTPHNIDEFGTNYLSRRFPRAVTGQLLHDCGVYALRVAYVLSLVVDDLALVIRAIVLPAHVGLILSFKDDPLKSVVVVHNAFLEPIDAAELAKAATTWQSTSSTGSPLAAPVALDGVAFMAELASAVFLDGVDLPYRLAPVPTVPAKASRAARHQVLWKFYHTTIIKPSPLSPVSGEPQPELRYLALLQQGKHIHDRLLIPALQVARQYFIDHAKPVEQAARDLRTTDPRRRQAALATLGRHRVALLQYFEPLGKARTALANECATANQFLTAHPKAVTLGAHVSPTARLNFTRVIYSEIQEYLADKPGPGLAPLISGNLAAPFSAAATLPEPAD